MTTIDPAPRSTLQRALAAAAPPTPKGGRLRVPDRAVLGAIVFKLRAGLPALRSTSAHPNLVKVWRPTSSLAVDSV